MSKKIKLHELAKSLGIPSSDLVNWYQSNLGEKINISQYLTPNEIEAAMLEFSEGSVEKEKMPLFGIYQRGDGSWSVAEFEFTTPRQEVKFVREYDDDGVLKYKSMAVLHLENIMQHSKLYKED